MNQAKKNQARERRAESSATNARYDKTEDVPHDETPQSKNRNVAIEWVEAVDCPNEARRLARIARETGFQTILGAASGPLGRLRNE